MTAGDSNLRGRRYPALFTSGQGAGEGEGRAEWANVGDTIESARARRILPPGSIFRPRDAAGVSDAPCINLQSARKFPERRARAPRTVSTLDSSARRVPNAVADPPNPLALLRQSCRLLPTLTPPRPALDL